MSNKPVIKEVPACAFISICLILVYSLYVTNIIERVPCDNNNLDSQMISNFVHFEYSHLLSNLFGLYSLSRVEKEIGPKKFIYLCVSLLILNSIFEIIIHKLRPSEKCSVGFSGVLFGITTWEIITKEEVDIYLLITIVLLIVIPSLKYKKISLSGHCIGALSGIIFGLVYNKLKDEDYIFNNEAK